MLLAKEFQLQKVVALDHIRTSLHDFNKAIELFECPSGLYLRNRAYAQFLLDKTQEAKQSFTEAFRVEDSAAFSLIESTRKDLATHLIPEEAAILAMVENAWATYQQEQNDQPPTTAAQSPH